jgi:mannose-6-phosphate isomerase
VENKLTDVIFLTPVFKERIWGGTKLRDMYGYDIPSNETGECWAISAHPNGQSKVRSGPYEGKTLGELWENERQLFGNIEGKQFPLLTKILDASSDLSVQVHPDDTYASKHENGELGKTECWYIIDCEVDSEIIFGHTATDRDQLASMINKGQWNELLTQVKVEPGDFFYVPSGTIHALGKGVVVLETQQSSDTTYRVYDYDRKDAEGNLRELHLDKAIQVTSVPHEDLLWSSEKTRVEGNQITTYVSNEFFTVSKWDLDGAAVMQHNTPFKLVSILEGEGKLTAGNKETVSLKKGDHFILPNDFGTYVIEGKFQAIASHL